MTLIIMAQNFFSKILCQKHAFFNVFYFCGSVKFRDFPNAFRSGFFLFPTPRGLAGCKRSNDVTGLDDGLDGLDLADPPRLRPSPVPGTPPRPTLPRPASKRDTLVTGQYARHTYALLTYFIEAAFPCDNLTRAFLFSFIKKKKKKTLFGSEFFKSCALKQCRTVLHYFVD